MEFKKKLVLIVCFSLMVLSISGCKSKEKDVDADSDIVVEAEASGEASESEESSESGVVEVVETPTSSTSNTNNNNNSVPRNQENKSEDTIDAGTEFANDSVITYKETGGDLRGASDAALLNVDDEDTGLDKEAGLEITNENNGGYAVEGTSPFNAQPDEDIDNMYGFDRDIVYGDPYAGIIDLEVLSDDFKDVYDDIEADPDSYDGMILGLHGRILTNGRLKTVVDEDYSRQIVFADGDYSGVEDRVAYVIGRLQKVEDEYKMYSFELVPITIYVV